MKLCITCKIEKDLSDFTKRSGRKDGLSTYCKACQSLKNKLAYQKHRDKRLLAAAKRRVKPDIKEYNRVKSRNYYKSNKEKFKLLQKQYLNKNQEKIKNDRKKYYKNNKEIINVYQKQYRESNKEKLKEYWIKYYKLNKDKNKQYCQAYNKANRKYMNTYARVRYNRNPNIRINSSISKAICKSLRGKKFGIQWINLVDYSLEDLMKHLESKFTNGMSFENYGKNGWEIDHIIPKSHFIYKDAQSKEFKACWALSNLQPLWATTEIAISYGESLDYLGNRQKGDRIY